MLKIGMNIEPKIGRRPGANFYFCSILCYVCSMLVSILCYFIPIFPIISVFKSPAGTEFHLDRKSI